MEACKIGSRTKLGPARAGQTPGQRGKCWSAWTHDVVSLAHAGLVFVFPAAAAAAASWTRCHSGVSVTQILNSNHQRCVAT